MARTYYTLLLRDSVYEPFGVHFGSYDKEEVFQEREDMRDSGHMARCLRVMTSKDTQADIDAKLADVNAKYTTPRPSGKFSQAC